MLGLWWLLMMMMVVGWWLMVGRLLAVGLAGWLGGTERRMG